MVTRNRAPASTTLRFDVATDWQLSANQRLHWAQKAQRSRYLRNYAAIVVEGTLPMRAPRPFMDRAHLTVRIGWPDKRRRDAANLAPTLKALIDGIVDAGLLPDDDDTHLIGPDLRPRVAGKKGFVVLDFEFTEIGADHAART